MSESHTKESRINSGLALHLSGVMVTLLVGSVAAYTMSVTPLFLPAALLAALQFALFVTYTWLERRAIHDLLFWLQGVVIAALLFIVPSDFVYILTVPWLVLAVESYGLKASNRLIAASLVVFIFAQLSHYGLGNPLDLVVSTALYGLLQVFAVSVMQRFITEREQRELTATLNRELIATHELLSQSAAQNERLRIARDLHDILGHHMTALILNLEVVSHSVSDEPKEKVEQSLAIARMLLSDLRSTVSELREDSAINLEESIQSLVSGIPGLKTDVDFSAAPQIDDVDTAETLLRCTQEAVTNVLRHSNASQCRIAMTGSKDQMILTVIDNGASAGPVTPGNGLTGMRERVVGRGGSLDWTQGPDGFQLRVVMGSRVAA